jgi:hypothetical protein
MGWDRSPAGRSPQEWWRCSAALTAAPGQAHAAPPPTSGLRADLDSPLTDGSLTFNSTKTGLPGEIDATAAGFVNIFGARTAGGLITLLASGSNKVEGVNDTTGSHSGWASPLPHRWTHTARL